jgi:hypothetical protein
MPRSASLPLSAFGLVKISGFLLALLFPTARLAAQDATVDYTGRLFGYYRIEALENTSQPHLNVVKGFPDRSPSSPILLGMGDNFAPEFGASIQQEFSKINENSVWAPCSVPAPVPNNQTQLKERQYFAPESLYKSESRLPSMADCDNVTRFLMTAGYRAIVPGREDFIYSATWLRRIAALMKGASNPDLLDKNPFETYAERSAEGADKNRPKDHANAHRKWKTETSVIENQEHKLHMLAANLRVKVVDSCPLFFADDLAVAVPCAKGETTVTQQMDWLRRIDQSLQLDPSGHPVVEESMQRQATSNRDFNLRLIKNQQDILKTLIKGYGDLPVQLPQGGQETLTGIANRTFNPTTPEPKPDPNSDHLLSQPCKKFVDNAPAPVADEPSAKLSAIARDLVGKMREDLCTGGTSNVLLSRESRKYVVSLLLHLIFREQENNGLTIANVPDLPELDRPHKHALLIGVVGTETMQEISHDYFTVIPDDQDCPNPQAAPENIVCKSKPEIKKDHGVFVAEFPPKTNPKAVRFDLSVGDPRFAVTTLLRAAWEEKHDGNVNFDSVIVMAQMPHTEADELGAHVRGDINDLYKDDKGQLLDSRPSVDMILSEAETEHQTPTIEIGLAKGEVTPVLTPADASTLINDGAINPISSVTLSDKQLKQYPHVSRVLENTLPNRDRSSKATVCQNAACKLEAELGKSPYSAEFPAQRKQCNVGADNLDPCEESVLMQYLLRQLQKSAKADVVVLKRRDFYFDSLGSDYTNYDVCGDWAKDHPNPDIDFEVSYCRLHTALDRVLWKGDYSERVLVDGTTLAGLMKTAKSQTDQEQTLLARDLHQEWLMTYGIVTAPATNLAAAASGPEGFTLPGLDGCNLPLTPLVGKDPGASDTAYCIDGQSIAPDRAYWLATSNQLAEDTTVYADLGNLLKKNPANLNEMKDLFLTTEIANQILPSPTATTATTAKNSTDVETIGQVELHHQIRSLAQLDFTKLVAGYSLTDPSLSAADLATYLDGVTNSTATNPKSQELDLEAATRLTYAPLLSWLAFGIQSDAEFDRKFTQNITGSPDTLAYSINTYSVGAFAQLALPAVWKPKAARSAIDLSTRNLSRLYLVIAPFQFQRQIAATYLAFPFYTPASGSSKATFSTTQFDNVRLPIPMGFSQRIGLRLETSGLPKWTPDPGSYIEIGPEYFVQNNVLSEVELRDIPSTTGPKYAVCPANAMGVIFTGNGSLGNPFINCAKNYYSSASPQVPLTSASNIVAIPQTLHAGGFYWTAHIQKNIDARKTYSISFDTAGDSYLLPGFVLSTQTRYALTTKLAFNFKIIPSLPNLTLSPTWSGFYYENQGDEGATPNRISLITNGFNISAKWYFARDAAVPFSRQPRFAGPASVDQTGSAKMK